MEAANGNYDAAIASFVQAIEAHRPSENPFELARTELLYGATLRRAKRRGKAREMIESALRRFEDLGARQWAARARSELELTPTERQVAELVATGRSNKEVAAQLFMSVRTVEDNLSKIYRKLEIQSRSELAAFLNRI